MDELKLTDDEATLVDDEIISAEDEAEKRRQERRRIVARRMLRNPSDPTLTAGENEGLVEEALARCLEALESGSSCVILDAKDADKKMTEALKSSGACLCGALPDGIDAKPLYLDKSLDKNHPALYLTRFALDETRVAQRVKEMPVSESTPEDAGPVIEELKGMGFKLEEQQENALKRVAQGGLMVLTGGPGTGKTTVITRMLALLLSCGVDASDVRLAAPTGKAAARIDESIGSECEALDDKYQDLLAGLPKSITLHRLLGMRYSSLDDYKYGRDNKLSGRVFIVDEVSMVSLPLMRRFLEAVPDDATVVLVGDPDQLESVESGTVLADLVDGLGDADVIKLDVTKRNEGVIKDLVAAINNGDSKQVLGLLGSNDADKQSVRAIDKLSDKFKEIEGTKKSPIDELVSHYKDVAALVQKGKHADALEELSKLQLLCTNRRGELGGEHWNQVIASKIKKRGDKSAFGEYSGTPVMITRNQKALGVSNGDVGIVVAEKGADENEESTFNVCLPSSSDDVRYIPRALLTDVEPAYAITIHKSQGSQYDRVIVQLGEKGNRLNTRELLYTGVSRAKNDVTVVGSKEAIDEAVKTQVKRASLLDKRLRSGD